MTVPWNDTQQIHTLFLFENHYKGVGPIVSGQIYSFLISSWLEKCCEN